MVIPYINPTGNLQYITPQNFRQLLYVGDKLRYDGYSYVFIDPGEVIDLAMVDLEPGDLQEYLSGEELDFVSDSRTSLLITAAERMSRGWMVVKNKNPMEKKSSLGMLPIVPRGATRTIN